MTTLETSTPLTGLSLNAPAGNIPRPGITQTRNAPGVAVAPPVSRSVTHMGQVIQVLEAGAGAALSFTRFQSQQLQHETQLALLNKQDRKDAERTLASDAIVRAGEMLPGIVSGINDGSISREEGESPEDFMRRIVGSQFINASPTGQKAGRDFLSPKVATAIALRDARMQVESETILADIEYARLATDALSLDDLTIGLAQLGRVAGGVPQRFHANAILKGLLRNAGANKSTEKMALAAAFAEEHGLEEAAVVAHQEALKRQLRTDLTDLNNNLVESYRKQLANRTHPNLVIRDIKDGPLPQGRKDSLIKEMVIIRDKHIKKAQMENADQMQEDIIDSSPINAAETAKIRARIEAGRLLEFNHDGYFTEDQAKAFHKDLDNRLLEVQKANVEMLKTQATLVPGGKAKMEEHLNAAMQAASDDPGYVTVAERNSIMSQYEKQKEIDIKRQEAIKVVLSGKGVLDTTHESVIDEFFSTGGFDWYNPQGITNPEELTKMVFRIGMVTNKMAQSAYAGLQSGDKETVGRAIAFMGEVSASSDRLKHAFINVLGDTQAGAVYEAERQFVSGTTDPEAIKQSMSQVDDLQPKDKRAVEDMRRNDVVLSDQIVTVIKETFDFIRDLPGSYTDDLWWDPDRSKANSIALFNVASAAYVGAWRGNQHLGLDARKKAASRAALVAVLYRFDVVRWGDVISLVDIEPPNQVRMSVDKRWAAGFEEEARADLIELGHDPDDVLAPIPAVPKKDKNGRIIDGWNFIMENGERLKHPNGELVTYEPGGASVQTSKEWQKILNDKIDAKNRIRPHQARPPLETDKLDLPGDPGGQSLLMPGLNPQAELEAYISYNAGSTP